MLTIGFLTGHRLVSPAPRRRRPLRERDSCKPPTLLTRGYRSLDGCTNQLAEIFGNNAGLPARVAVGMAELPLGAAVETEMTVALHD